MVLRLVISFSDHGKIESAANIARTVSVTYMMAVIYRYLPLGKNMRFKKHFVKVEVISD